MQLFKSVFVLIQSFLLSVCFGELSSENKEKFLNGFVEYLNNLPDHVYTYDEGVLLNAQKTDDGNGCYYIEARLRANDIHDIDSSRYLKCSTKIQDLQANGITIQDNQYHCEDVDPATQPNVSGGDTLEDIVVEEPTTIAAIHEPVHLDNEVQPNTGVTSGEEFIAVPRKQYGGSCTGCSSHVNPQAAGVSDLAALAITHLDRHEPTTKHLLQSVLDVERQVQIVNGVRYTLTLQVGFDACTSTTSDSCFDSKICKISILEKSWIKVSDGSKYRAVLSNNCTRIWIFGDEGEYIPNNEINDIDINPPSQVQDKLDDATKPIPDYDKIANTAFADEILKAIHNTDVQAKIQQDKTLTEKELKDLEKQIIPRDKIYKASLGSFQTLPKNTEETHVKLHHISEIPIRKQSIDSSVQYKQPEYEERVDFLNEDRKKAIDDLINLFNSAGFDHIHDDFSRVKRSYELELKSMSIAEKIHKIKKNINKAKYLYTLAQNMVNYLNEMDLEIKTRVLLDVIAAEEEFENYQNFFYIQARIVIPCDKANCGVNDSQNKICNGIIETTDSERPQILSAFCYEEQKKKLQHSKTEIVEFNDPILLKLTQESLNKIELESAFPNAMRIEKIVQAYTKRASGTITKITVSLSYTDCNKTVPYIKRKNCTIVQNMDSNLCEITVHERHWLKEKKITYKCAQRPMDERFSNKTDVYNFEGTIKDKKILDMTQEALQYLEVNSNKNSKQKVVQINSVTTQLIGGLLTEIEFIVGYTTCSNDFEVDLKSCELLDKEPLRKCKAQVWDRPWLEDDRQINVNCDDSRKENILNSRKKRSSNFFVGGQKSYDPNDSKYESLAKESLRNYLQSNGVSEIYKVVEVENVTVQVVAGTVTRIVFKIAPKNANDKEIHCYSEIWEQPWLHKKDFNVSCGINNEKQRKKWQVPGGKKDQNVNDSKYRQKAEESLKHYLQNTGSTQHYQTLNVEKVTTQVVSGSLTEIDFTITPTNCQLNNNMEPTSSTCEILNPSNIIRCHSRIWEQAWLDKKDFNVSCGINNEKQRKKRAVPGGKKDQNVNDSKYRQKAEESLKHYLQNTGSTQHYQTLNVEKVTTQVVSGSLTEIDFTITPTNCQLNNNMEPTSSTCEILNPSNIIRCHSRIWEQAWLDKKDFNVSCGINNEKQRKKRAVPGGKKDQNVNDSKYRQKAEESLKHYLQNTGSTQHYQTLNVEKVTTQVVSGSLTEIDFTITPTNCQLNDNMEPTSSTCEILNPFNIIRCHSRIWEQAWLHKKDFNVSCGINNEKQRKKREVPGGKKDQNVNDSKYRQKAEESLKHYLQNTGSTQHYQTLNVEKVTTQVVSGLLTEIDFTITPTNCQLNNNMEPTSSTCEILNYSNIIKCHSRIWEQAWLDKKDFNVSCGINNEKQRKKRAVPGGKKDQNVNDSKYRQKAEESLKHYLQNTGSTQHYQTLNVEKVTTQVVSGSLTEIDFTITPTNCQLNNNMEPTSSTCEILNYSNIIRCHSRIWEQAWLDKKDFNVSCGINNEKQRKKRAVPGGKKDQNVNDLKYRQKAEESLKHYLQNTGSTQHYQTLNVEKVTTQVVSVSLTEIDFTITPTNCQLNNNMEPTSSTCDILNPSNIIRCHSRIWEQAWLDKKDFNVSCGINNEKQRKKRAVHGGKKDQNVNESKYRQKAEESLKHYLQNTGSTQHYQTLNVEKVTTQVVSGSLTEIDFTITPTNCQLNDNMEPTSSTCEILNYSNIIKCHSRIWEQAWLDKKDFNVSCGINNEKQRKKRAVPGGKKDQNVNDSKYRQKAEESLKHYLQNTGSTQHYQTLNVEKVTTQVVSGLLTEIDFTITPTNCQLNNNMEPTSSTCEILNPSYIIRCHSRIVEQAWLDKKDFNVSCGINNEKQRKKRQVPGGKIDRNVNDSIYRQKAEESLKHYLRNTGSKQHHQVMNVEQVTTQVVSGSLTEIDFTITPTNCQLNNNMEPTSSTCDILNPSNIIRCHSRIWEKPWSNKRDITVKCFNEIKSLNAEKQQNIMFIGPDMEPNPKKIEYEIDKGNMLKSNKIQTSGSYLGTSIKTDERRKRSLKGKKVKQDPNLAEFKLLAQDSLREYQKHQLNKSSHYEVTKVEKVVKQTVSGVKFFIEFIAKPIECTESKLNAPECRHSQNDTLYCYSVIWKRPWKGVNNIDVDCYGDNIIDEDFENDRKKRSVLLGASVAKDINDEYYKSLAEQSLAKYQRLSNAKYIHKIIQIHNVSKQIVAGTLTKIEYSISPTECLIADSPIYMNNCNILKPKTELLCEATIWDRPWMKSDKDITIECKSETVEKSEMINKNRNKRQIAPIEDFIDEDLKYYYADRAIQHINDKTDTNNIQKLVAIHAIQNVLNMGVNTIRMYIETAFTYCIRHQDDIDLSHCEELTGMYHRLCYVRLWPSPDDELVITSIAIVCDDEPDFKSITGISILDLIKASLKDIEASPKMKYKMIHQGEPNIIPSLDSRIPFILSFVAVTTNCSKYIDIDENPFSCYVDTNRIPRSCTSSMWMVPNSKKIRKIKTSCSQPDKRYRSKRSISLESMNVTTDEKTIQDFVKESLEKLEMSSIHKYKQRVLQINSFNTKIIKGKLTTIDFDVGYTTCLKYEWVDNITQCEFIEHLPRRHCVSQIRERLWLNNGKQIEVHCEDDETPLEATIEFESAENAMQLAREALKHIEAKYPHPRKQKVVRIFSLDKQEIAGVHYRMKLEVGYTDCLALSIKDDCNLDNNIALNKFCRANIWLRPWTEHPPIYRVSCDYQDGITNEIYHKIQTEHLFSDFLTTYRPDYINDHIEMLKRYEIFQNNVRKIHEFNIQERGTARYAVTRFSDLTYEEFGQKYLGLKPSLRDTNQIPIRKADIPQVHLPDAFDWRKYDAVTEVKDQGSCGSCWAFSVTGNIEGQWKMQSGELVSLSEQELVDCDKLDEGCNGGLPDNAYRAIEQLGGLEAENDYPYEGENDKCAFNKTLSRVQISGAVNISSNETDMAKWLVQNGPISIGINANAMQFYVGGVSHPWKMLCSPSNLDHGVLIVGYGVKDYPLFHKRLPYWIIKNSWGKQWGEQGYYRVYRGDGTCGVNQMASSAVI